MSRARTSLLSEYGGGIYRGRRISGARARGLGRASRHAEYTHVAMRKAWVGETGRVGCREGQTGREAGCDRRIGTEFEAGCGVG